MNTPETPPSGPGPWGEPETWQSYTEPVEKPQSIRTAVNLMYVGAILSALGILFTFLQRDEMRDQIRESDDSLTADELDTAVAFGLTFVAVVGVIAIGLWLWMASANGRGKSWARIVATVLGGLNILFTLLGFAGGQLTPLGVVISILGLVLSVAILVLLFRPDSNRYYDAMAPR